MRILRRAEDVPKRSLWQRIKDVALTDVGVLVTGVDPGSIERLEELLLEADFGVPTTMRLVADVERMATRGEIRDQNEFAEALRQVSQIAWFRLQDTVAAHDPALGELRGQVHVDALLRRRHHHAARVNRTAGH